MIEASLIPYDYKEKDPRSLLYHFPKMPTVIYAKKMQEFSFYQALDVAEQMAKAQGYCLVPYSCIHYRRRQILTDENKKIKIGRNSFFLLKKHDMTKNEYKNYQELIGGHLQ